MSRSEPLLGTALTGLPVAVGLATAAVLAIKGQLAPDTAAWVGVVTLGGAVVGRSLADRVSERLRQRLQAVAEVSTQLASGSLKGSLSERNLPAPVADALKQMSATLNEAKQQHQAVEATRVVLEGRIEQLNALHAFLDTFAGMDDLDVLLEGITDRCQQIFESQVLLFWLTTPEGAGLKTWRGLDDAGLALVREGRPDVSTPFFEPLRRGEVLTAQPQEVPPELKSRLPVTPATLYCAVPLRGGNDLVGFLEFLTTDASIASADIRRLLGILGREAAMVVRNVQLYFDVVDQRNRSKLLLQTIGEGVYSMDESLRITSFNPAAERLTGYTAAEAIGKHCWDVFEGRDKDGNRVCTPESCYVRKALAAGEGTARYELKLRLRDGSQLDSAFLARTHRGMKGDALEVVSTFRDVTQAKEIEQMRVNLLNTVTHELKTPITSIKGCVATLTHPKANFTREAQKNFLGIIQEEADRLNHLITDLLQAAQLTSDMLVLNPQDVLLRPAVERVVNRYEGLSKKHTFLTDWLGEGRVQADLDRLEYVLQHLVSNAVKFSPQGGEVRLTVRDVDGFVQVSVQDQGIGIPLHQRERIFEVFHRLDMDDNRKTYGVGMGLYLARKIIQAHGGRIWVDSVLGGGSSFTFTVPIHK